MIFFFRGPVTQEQWRESEYWPEGRHARVDKSCSGASRACELLGGRDLHHICQRPPEKMLCVSRHQRSF